MLVFVFVEPDWNAPIDFNERLAATPAKANVRGMFLQLLMQGLGPEATAQVRDRRYVAFKNYPMRDYIELLALSCKSGQSRFSAAERVRQLGKAVYPNYANTITGTAIFAVAGRNYRRVLELCPAAYRIASDVSEVTVRSISDDHAVVELRNLWNLPDYHQVGIFEGAMQVCGAQGNIRVQTLGFGDADFDITWRSAPSTSYKPRRSLY
jgi:uncharacterized protein (TIGR02265 family)